MALTLVKCPSCGEDVELDNEREAEPCPLCGVRIIYIAAEAFYHLTNKDVMPNSQSSLEAKIRRGIETQNPIYFHEVLDIDPDNLIARKNLAIINYTGLVDKTHSDEWLITRYIKNSIYYRPILWTTFFSRSFFGNKWKLMSFQALTKKMEDENLSLTDFFDLEHFRDLPQEDQKEIIHISGEEWFYFIYDNQKQAFHNEIRDLPGINETCQAIILLCDAFARIGAFAPGNEMTRLFAYYVKALYDQIMKAYADCKGACSFSAEEMLSRVADWI